MRACVGFLQKKQNNCAKKWGIIFYMMETFLG